VWEYPLDGGAAGSARQVTFIEHPQPALLGVQKRLIKYKRRNDGLELSGMLYTPKGYSPKGEGGTDGPLPALLWAYPTEFKTEQSAGQVQGSPHRFVRVSPTSPLLWVSRGYAVLDDPSMPIVAKDGGEENDFFVPQLVDSAESAVDELQRLGVTDDRVAVGGHSYGAFMTANLLAHSRRFKAGIGRSGAYNRLLTPFGFQSEERTLWEAPDTYVTMSPFMHADKVEAPLLLLHGESDNNPGTFPIQSERLFQALKGLGKTAKLVVLPLESHGYAAKENVLHMCYEMDTWLEKHMTK
jgi:dipeptidyl aminopeptidase/acylaminoacyl peptidase